MNIALALEELGYVNIVDFEVHGDDENVIAVWNHGDAQPDTPTLSAAYLTFYKRAGRFLIDVTAEQARLRYVTAGSGQAMVYLKKGDEADAYVLAGYPADTSGYPFIEAEINATGKTKEVAADDIVAQRNAWVILGASIEEERLGGKKAIDDATDEAGVDTARDATIIALDAI